MNRAVPLAVSTPSILLKSGFHGKFFRDSLAIDEVRSENHRGQSNIASSSCRSAVAVGKNHYFGAFRKGRNRPGHNRFRSYARRSTIWAERIHQSRTRAVPARQESIGNRTRLAAALHTFNPRGQTGMWSSAVSAIDIALWDIKGKKYNEPVWRLLGGAHIQCSRT
jgi:hypothetical protein